MTHYDGPPIDHGLLSPSGRISKRSRAAALKRYQAGVSEWWDKEYPPPTAEERAKNNQLALIESLTRHAERLEEFARQGYRTRYHNKHAAKARQEIEDLQR